LGLLAQPHLKNGERAVNSQLGLKHHDNDAYEMGKAKPFVANPGPPPYSTHANQDQNE
jgi:hypothetical protein